MDILEKQYKRKIGKLEKQNEKLFVNLKSAYQKLEANSKIMYEIRKKNVTDIEYLFGKQILGVEECGGFGYGNLHSRTGGGSSQ